VRVIFLSALRGSLVKNTAHSKAIELTRDIFVVYRDFKSNKE